MPIDKTPDGTPFAFADIPAKEFPVEVVALAPDGSVVWERTIDPYTVVHIPGVAPELRGKITVRTKFGTGVVIYSGPMSTEEAEAHIEARNKGKAV